MVGSGRGWLAWLTGAAASRAPAAAGNNALDAPANDAQQADMLMLLLLLVLSS